jgi:hypothetical protein
MSRFFTYLQSYRSGILFFLFCLAAVALLVQWFSWIFGIGRFAIPSSGDQRIAGSGKAELRYIFSEATVKIINDFRHLLALLIVLIFAFALGYSLIKSASVQTNANTPSVIDNMKEALQGVVATLGGLVGSIIGYYFGESSVTKAAEPRPPTPAPDATPIKPVSGPELPEETG